MSDHKPTQFANVAEFVEQYLGTVYRRQVTDLSDTVWCPEWWRHPEAGARMHEVWRSWEHLNADRRAGMSTWLLDHADPAMAALFDPKGPFKFCSVRSGHKAILNPLPLKSPPAGMFGADAAGLGPEKDPVIYETVQEFVENYFSLVFQRQVTDQSDTVWCPEWWRHHEAVVRLDALWWAWEHSRQDSQTGLSYWFRDHADPHIARLFDPKGPFKHCGARTGHKELLSPLPVTAEGSGLFTDPPDAAMFR